MAITPWAFNIPSLSLVNASILYGAVAPFIENVDVFFDAKYVGNLGAAQRLEEARPTKPRSATIQRSIPVGVKLLSRRQKLDSTALRLL